MKTVTTIHLNGRAYQVEEEAHKALAAYLEKAADALADNPDKDEIMADFETAIAEKFAKYLTPNKNVITGKEIETIIAEMGPVGGAQETADSAGETSESKSENAKERTNASGTPKRLYRIKQGAVIAGVCNGLAAYFDVDVVVVRIIFVVVTLVSHGFGILAYLVMMLVVPKADTSEEHARAKGVPFTAHEFIEQAKKNYAEFKEDGKGWKKYWKEQQKQWEYKAREMKHHHHRRERAENPWTDTAIGIFWLAVIIGGCFVAYQHVPFFHYNFDRLGHWMTVRLGKA